MTYILVSDDDPGILSALEFILEPEGYNVSCARSPSEAVSKLKTEDLALALVDLNYTKDTTSGAEGMDLIAAIRAHDDYLPIVVMSGWGSVDSAVRAMKAGANDYIQKPWENERLLSIIQNQLELASSRRHSVNLQQKSRMLQQQLLTPKCGSLICESKAMQNTMDTIMRVAVTDANILLSGENGTGKSLMAGIVHSHSMRADDEFISVNMGAVPESLFESEMFGHVKGAFTDAKSARIGRFELASGGTLFLDEIGNTPYSQQMKLLRVLEERKFEKVGSSKTQVADIRLICASNSSLDEAVESGQFRKDLLFRINTVEIAIPALRDRKEDILPLAEGFLEQAAKKNSLSLKGFDEGAQKQLHEYNWPGNVRELSHVVERAAILSRGDSISREDLGLFNSQEQWRSKCGQSEQTKGLSQLLNESSLEQIESLVLDQRLKQFDGSVVEAAKSLGLSRSAFYRRLQKG